MPRRAGRCWGALLFRTWRSPLQQLRLTRLLPRTHPTPRQFASPMVATADGEQPAILQLPPSRTGMHAVVSVRTLQAISWGLLVQLPPPVCVAPAGPPPSSLSRLSPNLPPLPSGPQLCAVIRTLGVKLVLVSGARLSTVMQRLPFLPAADAIVAESGGRVFYPGQLPTAAPLQARGAAGTGQAVGGACWPSARQWPDRRSQLPAANPAALPAYVPLPCAGRRRVARTAGAHGWAARLGRVPAC